MSLNRVNLDWQPGPQWGSVHISPSVDRPCTVWAPEGTAFDPHYHCPVCHSKPGNEHCPTCGHRGEMLLCTPLVCPSS
jgi:hypothetical protein